MAFWIFWPDWAARSLSLLCLIFLLLSGFVLVQRKLTSWTRIGQSLVINVLAFGLILGSNFILMHILLDVIGHIPAFPSPVWPIRGSLVGVSILTSYFVVWICQKYIDSWSAHIGVWLFWCLLASTSTYGLPGVSSTLLNPTILMSCVLLAISLEYVHAVPLTGAIGAVALLLAFPSTLLPAMQLEAAHGYGHLFFVFLLPFIALFAITFLPLIEREIKDGSIHPKKPFFWVGLLTFSTGTIYLLIAYKMGFT